jgi:hypothetical protein
MEITQGSELTDYTELKALLYINTSSTRCHKNSVVSKPADITLYVHTFAVWSAGLSYSTNTEPTSAIA